MKTYFFIFLILLFITPLLFAQNVVQIATTKDTTGHYSNWIIQDVTWDNTIIADVGDHSPVSYKSLQTWYFPVENGFIKAIFVRKILGVYAIRWSLDGDIWSDAASVIILKPNQPKLYQ